jgi:hypothetical protein
MCYCKHGKIAVFYKYFYQFLLSPYAGARMTVPAVIKNCYTQQFKMTFPTENLTRYTHDEVTIVSVTIKLVGVHVLNVRKNEFFVFFTNFLRKMNM